MTGFDSNPAAVRLRRALGRTRDKLWGLSGRQVKAGRNAATYPNDTFIVSYPRSGNTWMRFLLGELVSGRDVDFHNMENHVPDIYRCTHVHLEALPRPRLLKSHEPYEPRYPKVLYLVRDPRDVVVSYYEWLRKFGKDTTDFHAFIRDFSAGRTRYGGWAHHVGSWIAHQDEVRHGFLMVRYEDLLTNIHDELSRIVRFLGLSADTDRINEIARANEFAQMREKEQQAAGSSIFAPTRTDIKFVRSGRAGQWRERLQDPELKQMNDGLGQIAARVGYDFDTRA